MQQCMCRGANSKEGQPTSDHSLLLTSIGRTRGDFGDKACNISQGSKKVDSEEKREARFSAGSKRWTSEGLTINPRGTEPPQRIFNRCGFAQPRDFAKWSWHES